MGTLSHLSFSSFLILALSLSHVVSGASFERKLSVVGSQFFDQFDWDSRDDPTHGRVNYLTKDQARAKNLAYATGDKFFMYPDSKNVVTSGSRGRDSNRISSKQAFDESVVILDIEHMPYGCATWPAFWTLSKKGPWPTGGEIDIIEGVNMAQRNLISLHTRPGCTMPQSRDQTGTTTSTNCDTNFNNNQGCGTRDAPGSYGKSFNSIGGGIYALARSKEEGIKVWFWPREGSFYLPPGLISDDPVIDPDQWGTPTAYFPTGDNCEYEQYFDAHKIIFDLTFCGDWAGSVWGKSGCSPMSCNDFVDQNPDKFADAYWEINSLRVYTPVSN